MGDRRSTEPEKIARRSSQVFGMWIATSPACSRQSITLRDWIMTRLIRFGLGWRLLPRAVQMRHPDASAFCAMRRPCAEAARRAKFSELAARAGLDPGDHLAL